MGFYLSKEEKKNRNASILNEGVFAFKSNKHMLIFIGFPKDGFKPLTNAKICYLQCRVFIFYLFVYLVMVCVCEHQHQN